MVMMLAMVFLSVDMDAPLQTLRRKEIQLLSVCSRPRLKLSKKVHKNQGRLSFRFEKLMGLITRDSRLKINGQYKIRAMKKYVLGITTLVVGLSFGQSQNNHQVCYERTLREMRGMLSGAQAVSFKRF